MKEIRMLIYNIIENNIYATKLSDSSVKIFSVMENTKNIAYIISAH